MAFLLATIVATFFGTLLVVEGQAWMPYVSRWLLRRTTARFPDGLAEDLRSRWEEEMEADLAAYGDRPVGGLLFSLRLRRRGGKALAAELALGQALEAAPPKPVPDEEAEPMPAPSSEARPKIILDANLLADPERLRKLYQALDLEKVRWAQSETAWVRTQLLSSQTEAVRKAQAWLQWASEHEGEGK